MKTFKPLLAVFLGAMLASCDRNNSNADVTFAKSTFNSIVRGETSAAANIDWDTFSSMGIPVGPQYLALQTEPERNEFTTGFISQFSASFRDSGGSVERLTNWRATFSDETRTEVTADSPDGSLVLTVSHKDSGKKLSSMKTVE